MMMMMMMMMMMTQVVQCEEVGSGSSFTLNFVFCPDGISQASFT
jgi:hypothetical protein